MKPEVKKWLIVGGLGVISVALAMGYLQYRKLMNYTVKLGGAKFKNISAKVFNFDLFIKFTNNSDINFVIADQEYKVYLNGKFVTKVTNGTDVTVLPKATNTIPVNIDFNPTDVLSLLGKNFTNILLHPETITIKVDGKLKVKLYGFTKGIPFVYEANLKELMASKKEA
jgi:LEA14-like dessication related protein